MRKNNCCLLLSLVLHSLSLIIRSSFLLISFTTYLLIWAKRIAMKHTSLLLLHSNFLSPLQLHHSGWGKLQWIKSICGPFVKDCSTVRVYKEDVGRFPSQPFSLMFPEVYRFKILVIIHQLYVPIPILGAFLLQKKGHSSFWILATWNKARLIFFFKTCKIGKNI